MPGVDPLVLLVVCDAINPYVKAQRFLKLANSCVEDTTTEKLAKRKEYQKRAYQLFEDAIQVSRPNPDAYFQLGRILEYGIPEIVEPNRSRAIALYKRATFYPPALCKLGEIKLQSGNLFEARTLFTTANYKKATSESLVALANLLMKSHKDFRPDPYRAMRYYLRAAEEFGNLQATEIVGHAIIEGYYGFISNTSRAISLYARAAREHKCVVSMVTLARIMLHGTYGKYPSPSRAVKLYMRAVSLGSTDAAVELGDAFRKGTNGIPVDCLRAYHLYENVHHHSNDAKFAMAYMLACGMRQVKCAAGKAADLFLSAVGNGGKWENWWTTEYTSETWEAPIFQSTRANTLLDIATASCTDVKIMKILADMLLVGRGFVMADPKKAGELYIKAINETSDTRSMRAVADILLTDMFELKSDVNEALNIYNRAAECGDIYGMRDLGHILYNGLHGVDIDRQKAILLWGQSCSHHLPTLRALRDGASTQMAINKYNEAIEDGAKNPKLFCDLADLIRFTQPMKAAQLYRKAEGEAEAATNLAEMLLFGEIERNVDEALKYIEKAGGRNLRARSMLAYLLEKKAATSGSKTADLRKARKAFKRAVERDGRPFVHAFVREIREKDELAEIAALEKSRDL